MQEESIWNEQTRKLLEECSVGCRMAVESFEQIKEYVKDTEFKKLINEYTEKHRALKMRLFLSSKIPETKQNLPVSWPAHFLVYYGNEADIQQ